MSNRKHKVHTLWLWWLQCIQGSRHQFREYSWKTTSSSIDVRIECTVQHHSLSKTAAVHPLSLESALPRTASHWILLLEADVYWGGSNSVNISDLSTSPCCLRTLWWRISIWVHTPVYVSVQVVWVYRPTFSLSLFCSRKHLLVSINWILPWQQWLFPH